MARSIRYQGPGVMYHVMNRGLARGDIAFSQADHSSFIQGLEELYDRYEVDVFAYCLMSNHYHLCLQTRLANLSRAMRHFGHTFAQRVNRRIGRDGPVFRGRFKSIVVSHEVYLLHLIRYIHFNPVEAGIVQEASDYAWSSAKNYSCLKFPRWLKGEEVMSYFGGMGAEALEGYESYMHEGIASEFRAFFERERIGPVLDEDSLWRAYHFAVKKGCLPGT